MSWKLQASGDCAWHVEHEAGSAVFKDFAKAIERAWYVATHISPFHGVVLPNTSGLLPPGRNRAGEVMEIQLDHGEHAIETRWNDEGALAIVRLQAWRFRAISRSLNGTYRVLTDWQDAIPVAEGCPPHGPLMSETRIEIVEDF